MVGSGTNHERGETMSKGNVENLIPNEERTPEERRKNAKKAGVASGKKRRERKKLKDELILLLKTGTMQEDIVAALVKKALCGDTKAFEVIRDTIGEKPVEKVEVTSVDRDIIEEVERMVHDDS